MFPIVRRRRCHSASREIAMWDRNSSWRRMVTFLGVLLAFTAAACNGGPTGPSDDELFGIYTGRWRGTINGFEVVLDVQAELVLPAHGGGSESAAARPPVIRAPERLTA